MHAQLAVAAEDVDQVAIQEAVVPDAFEDQVQLQPDVLEARQAAFGRDQGAIDALFVLREELLDDVVLVAEVVVEVARADLQFVGDVVGRDVRLALRVEQREAGFEDALARLAGPSSGLRNASFFTRSTYFFFASSEAVPLSLAQASYLAVPTKSKKPGLAPLTSPSAPLLVERIELEQGVVVGTLREVLDVLGGLFELA
jgi:hypothetical protein